MTNVLASIIFKLVQWMKACISCGMNESTNLKCVSQNFCTTLICPPGKTHKKFSAWNEKMKGKTITAFIIFLKPSFFLSHPKNHHISSFIRT